MRALTWLVARLAPAAGPFTHGLLPLRWKSCRTPYDQTTTSALPPRVSCRAGCVAAPPSRVRTAPRRACACAAPPRAGRMAEAASADGVFDVSQFDSALSLQALRVRKAEVHELCVVLRRLGALFDMPRLCSVVPDEASPEERLVLLKDVVTDADLSGLCDEAKRVIWERKLTAEPYTQRLTYDYWPAEHVLKVLLPAGVDVPGSFETVGHVAHLNLRDELLPHKYTIGRVLLDKNTRIKTVLNKVGTIESEFRVPRFEVIAGDSCLETEVRQHGAVFRLDYGEVYWNSRLEHEHKRLAELFCAGEVVCDLMAGIGPFAIPAARRRVTVHANDLNPRCAHYLRINVRANKVEDRVHVYNADARALLKALAGCSVECPNPGGEPVVAAPAGFDHVIMNLPASAVQFLDAFAGSFSAPHWEARSLPLVHCYSFLRTDETEDDVRKKVEATLGCALQDGMKMRIVRDVAPNKEMICITFRVPDFCRESPERAAKRARADTQADE